MKVSGVNGHRHQFKAIGELWRREKAITRQVQRAIYRRGKHVGYRSVKDTTCKKVGPLLQTVFCSGCSERREVIVRPVCS